MPKSSRRRATILDGNPLMQAGALQCDNLECNHQERPQMFDPSLIGKPCPKCGSNLLTEDDYALALKSISIMVWIDKWFGWILGSRGDNHVVLPVKIKDGKIRVEDPKPLARKRKVG